MAQSSVIARPARLNGAQDPSTRTTSTMAPSLDSVLTTTKPIASLIVLNAVQGWGKTSFATESRNPIFLMTPRETGLIDLMSAGIVRNTAHYPHPAAAYNQCKIAIQELLVKDHSFNTFVIDTITGVVDLLRLEILRTKFSNDAREFNSYGDGDKACEDEWQNYLDLLQKLRTQKNMTVICLAHTMIKNFKNPEGPDYDRYRPRMPDNLWAHLYNCATMVLFGQNETFVTATDKKNKKGKATGGNMRVLHTERTAAYDAKSKGLPPTIVCGSSHTETWTNFSTAVVNSRKQTQRTHVENNETTEEPIETPTELQEDNSTDASVSESSE